MQKKKSTLKKALPALVAGLVMTIFIVVATLAVGLNAFFNRSVSSAQAAGQVDLQASADQATLQDLQALVAQYQAREVQYKDELQQATDQISQINEQNQNYQQLVQALQNAGIIQIRPDGRVLISRQETFSREFDDD
jgi:uncharacterized protein (DUF2252 family)